MMLGERECVMRWGGIARLLFASGLAILLCHSTGLAAARIRVAQTSTVTNCMMGCNSQAASCQTTCLIPGTAPTGAATTGSNANKSAACQLNCTTQQINCQALCARTSPSP
jgi:hypothetical protein